MLASGDQIYGLGNRIPNVTIAPGASGIVVSNVMTNLSFGSSPLVTKNNLFKEVVGSLDVKGATLEQNTFLGLEFGNITIYTSAGGYLRNNRFIRVRAQDLKPLLTIVGDGAHQSANNIFLWGNQLTQPDAAVSVSAQKSITFVGWDDEAYAPSTTNPIYRFTGVDTLRMWTISGASPTNTQTLFDVGASNALLVGLRMGQTVATPKFNPIVFQSSVNNALTFSSFSPIDDHNPTGIRLTGANTANIGSNLANASGPVTGALAPAAAAALAKLVTSPQDAAPWESPAFPALSDPAGAAWNVGLESKLDSTAMLQALLDDPIGGLLDPGTYYISAPLKFHSGSRLIGGGEDITVIIAKDPSIDMLIDEDNSTSGSSNGFQFGDLTFEGGTNGIHLIGPAGVGRQYTGFFLSHVTFRNFSNAGIYIDQISGLDNGFLDAVNFVGCSTGFLQYANPAAAPGGPNSGYMDKVLFFHNQFVKNDTAVNLKAQRADNLNMFVESLFQDNANGAFTGTSQNNTILANSTFINNGGNPSVLGASVIISCSFRADANGISLLGGNLQIEGSQFSSGSSTTATVFNNSNNVFFSAGNNSWANYSGDLIANSQSDSIPLGNIEFGLFLNNNFGARPDLSKPAAFVYQAAVTTVADGAVNPVPSLLVGASYAAMPLDGGVGDGGASYSSDSGCSCGVASLPMSHIGGNALLALAGLLVWRRRASKTKRD